MLRHDRAWDFRQEFFRPGDCARHALFRRGQFEFGAQNSHQVPTLGAHARRHGQDQSIPLGRRNDGEGDARVSTGGLHDRAARIQFSGLLRRLNHCHADPVLYASQRIVRFHLEQDGAGTVAGNAVEPDQGGVENGLGDVFGNIHDTVMCFVDFRGFSTNSTTGLSSK